MKSKTPDNHPKPAAPKAKSKKSPPKSPGFGQLGAAAAMGGAGGGMLAGPNPGMMQGLP